MASGAQLNKVGNNGGIPLLSLTSAATAVASPLTAYGTIGVNDSGAFVTAIGMQTYTFQLVQVGGTAPTGYEVTIYGTLDPIAYQAYTVNGGVDGFKSVTGASGFNFNQTFAVPATSWAPIPGPAEQSGTGTSTNPITGTGGFFQAKIALVAVRAVLTTANSPAGSANVLMFAVP